MRKLDGAPSLSSVMYPNAVRHLNRNTSHRPYTCSAKRCIAFTDVQVSWDTAGKRAVGASLV